MNRDYGKFCSLVFMDHDLRTIIYIHQACMEMIKQWDTPVCVLRIGLVVTETLTNYTLICLELGDELLCEMML